MHKSKTQSPKILKNKPTKIKCSYCKQNILLNRDWQHFLNNYCTFVTYKICSFTVEKFLEYSLLEYDVCTRL